MMIGETMAYECFGVFAVTYHSAFDPSAEDFALYIPLHAADLARCPELRLLVWTDGGNLTASQRREVANTVPHADPTVSVVTSSPLIRGTIAALKWLRAFRASAFAPEDFEKALEYLGLDEAERRTAQQSVETLRSQVAARARRIG